MHLLQYCNGKKSMLTVEAQLETHDTRTGYMQFQIVDILEQHVFEDMRIGDSLYVYSNSDMDVKKVAKGRLLAWAPMMHEKEWRQMDSATGPVVIRWIPTNLRLMLARKREIVRQLAALEEELLQVNQCIVDFEDLPSGLY